MQNLIKDGKTLRYLNSGADVIKGGKLVPVGNIVGVATTDIQPGEEGVLWTEGVYRFPKVTGSNGVLAVGARVYVDMATGSITSAVSTTASQVTTPHVPAGVAWAAAISDALSADVKINI
jgi:predicted RecA/RadA family phage recombinase